MKICIVTMFSLCVINITLFAQKYTGIVYDGGTMKPIPYVNIGVVGKDVGTVSDSSGIYSINIASQLTNDTIRFSFIGYESKEFLVSDFIKSDGKVMLVQQPIELKEIFVSTGTMTEKLLGNKGMSYMSAGFSDVEKGYECGPLLLIKKRAFLKGCELYLVGKKYLNTAKFRINIYKQNGDDYSNILQSPFYINLDSLPKTDSDSYYVDFTQIESKGIYVSGNTLVTIEDIEDITGGKMFLRAGFLGAPTVCRKTSQGKWQKYNISVGIRVQAQVEK